MIRLLQILFLFLTWFSSSATPVFTKVTLPVYDFKSNNSIYGSDVSVLNAGASCILSNIKGCDDKCLLGVNGLVGTFDDLYNQAIIENKDVSKLDIGRSLQMGTFQALVGFLANKTIIYSFNKLTSTQFKNLLDDILAFPEKYGLKKVQSRMPVQAVF